MVSAARSQRLIRSGPSGPAQLGRFQSTHSHFIPGWSNRLPQVACLPADLPAPSPVARAPCRCHDWAQLLPSGLLVPGDPLAFLCRLLQHTSTEHDNTGAGTGTGTGISTLSCPVPAQPSPPSQPCPGATPRRLGVAHSQVPLPCWTSNLFNNIAAQHSTPGRSTSTPGTVFPFAS